MTYGGGMTSSSPSSLRIAHVALPQDWERAEANGSYDVSTRGVSLVEADFVHAATSSQLPGVLDAFYADVPDVLLSGDHARIATWRRDQALRRTTERRPDLRHPAEVLDDLEVRLVEPADAGELFTLQRACWVQEQQANPGVAIDALTEDLDDVRAWIQDGTVLVARRAGRLVGAVRGRLHEDRWDVGRLMVALDLHGQGIGRLLLERIEEAAPAEATSYELFTGARSIRNQRMYRRAGYRSRGEVRPGEVRMTKRR